MSVTIVHPALVAGRFSSTGVATATRLISDDDLVHFYNEVLAEAVAHNRAERFTKLLNDRGGDSEPLVVRLRNDPASALSVETVQAVSAVTHPVGETPESDSLDPFTTDFYEHINKGGASFSLGGALANVDYDADLTKRSGPGSGGTWNDAISSVDTGTFVLTTLLCENVGFGGEKLVLLVDDYDLVDNNWNDRASSVATGAVSLPDLLKIIEAILL